MLAASQVHGVGEWWSSALNLRPAVPAQLQVHVSQLPGWALQIKCHALCRPSVAPQSQAQWSGQACH